MTTEAQQTGIADKESYDGSIEQVGGLPPKASQSWTHEEHNTLKNTIDQHAPLITALIADLLGIIAGSTGVTLASLKSETDALNLILSADDTALDTAQERVDKIKQLLADIDSLVIADIAGLQTSLDGLQTGKESTGVAQALVTALEATIRGAGAVGVTLTSLKSETDALNAILSSDDSTLDTAQERVDKIKQLLSDIDTLAIGDVAGLQSALADLQTAIDGKEATGVAAALFAKLNLNAIDAEKTGITPIDVFIYDTRKDSDCGAWRHRAQNTSWYQEDLNTATRGSRREFPALAVIVIEADKCTVFDGDDPTLPMWRIFPLSLYPVTAAWGYSCVKAVNGCIWIGLNGSFGGFLEINLISDTLSFSRDDLEVYSQIHQSIVRDSIFAANAEINKYDLVNELVNDIDVTVLDDAPIDQATGLPIPTIAVATDGGVSVFNHDGSVANITNYAESPTILHFVDVGSSTKLLINSRYSSWSSLIDIPNSDISLGTTYFNRDYSGSAASGSITGYADSNKNIYIAKTTGLLGFCKDSSLVGSTGVNTPSLEAHITSTYNTGWMGGGNVLTALCSTDTSDLVGGTDDDRSLNGNDLNVVGTINRTLLGDGADMVAYSGFGASNRLELTNAVINDSLYGVCWVQLASGEWEVQHGIVSSNPIDGVSVSGNTITIAGTLSKAILRLSDSLSTDQIEKIYNDEKKFQNFPATLVGTSDAVAGIAFDERRNLLGVVTPSGRSEFDGLVRVGSTTEAANAIDMHDGLVVEG